MAGSFDFSKEGGAKTRTLDFVVTSGVVEFLLGQRVE